MKDEPPPEPDLPTNFSLSFGFLSAASRLTILAARGVRALAGLTLTEWRVLTVLAMAPGSSAAGVVRIVMVDKSVASRALRQLESSGLIAIQADRDDRRQSSLHLTLEGQALYDRVLPNIREAEEQAWTALSAGERLMLREMLARLSRGWAQDPDNDRSA